MNRKEGDIVDLSYGRCPCGSDKFFRGPRGGLAINIQCVACKATFNYCGAFLPSHRIASVPGVYGCVPATLAHINSDREAMLAAMRRVLASMKALGIPSEMLVEVLEVMLQEVRAALRGH